MTPSIFIAAIGASLTLWGRWFKVTRTPQKQAFFFGALLLLLAATLDGEPVLVSNETIISTGCFLAFFKLSHHWKQLIIGLVTLSVPVLVFTTGYEWDPWFILGLIGLVLSAYGFATVNIKFQLISSIILCFYNAMSWLVLGFPSASMFLALNFIFILLSLRALWAKSTTG